MNVRQIDNEDTTKKELNALYYPETICLDESELKYLLLLYDKIYFLPIDVKLNPGHTRLSKRFSVNDAILAGAYKSQKDAHYAIMYSSESNVWDDYLKQLMDLYDELEEKKVLIGLEDFEYSNPNELHPLRVAVDADMASSDFVNLCLGRRNKKIFLPDIDQSVIKGGGMMLRPPSYKGDNHIPSICSERLNTALYVAGRKELYPSCGSKLYIDLLKMKLKRMAQYPPGFVIPSNEKHRISMLSWEIATEVIPKKVIQRKRPKELMKYKVACIDLKSKFRSYLWNLESTISSQPWNAKFTQELNNIVKREIIPEVNRIREQKIRIWENLFSETVKMLTSVKIAPALVGIHLIPGLSFWQILEYSTLVISGAVLKPLADAWKEERKIRRNSLFFLLRLM